jgi:carboxyl-terminal processing protease
MEAKHYQKRIYVVLSVILAIGLFFGGLYTGSHSNLMNTLAQKIPLLGYNSAQAEISQEVTETQMSRFWYIWNLLDQKYPFKETTPKDEEKIHGAIAGLVASYKDPYTMFFPPTQAKLFNEEVKGEFGGIGIEFGVRGGVPTVIAPLKNSPAYIAGIKPGDVITSVDDKKVEENDIDKIVSWIRGNEGSKVTLSVIRKGNKEPLRFEIIRSKINIPVIDTEIKNDVFIIHFYTFSEKSAVLFDEALNTFNTSGKQKLLIDMRSNPGGYLDAAVEIASNILPMSEVIVREDNGSGNDPYIYRSRGYKKIKDNVQVGVLLDEGSASASEILAGALQDHDRAIIYGAKSFGKGSVQELIPLSDGSSVKITIAKWFTPDNHSISEKGITPDVVIDTEKLMKEKNKKDTGKTTDLVLDQALIHMNKK